MRSCPSFSLLILQFSTPFFSDLPYSCSSCVGSTFLPSELRFRGKSPLLWRMPVSLISSSSLFFLLSFKTSSLRSGVTKRVLRLVPSFRPGFSARPFPSSGPLVALHYQCRCALLIRFKIFDDLMFLYPKFSSYVYYWFPPSHFLSS